MKRYRAEKLVVPSVEFNEMKKFLLFLFLTSTTFTGRGQNLVPNGDFEGYSGCPDYLHQLDSALFWFNPTIATPDYYNQCSIQSPVGIPDNSQGYQQAHSGVGYAGMVLFTQPPYAPNYREYIEVPILSSLIANNCYHFEMYISHANKSKLAIDAIDVYFSDTVVISFPNYNPLPFTPQISNSTGIITDTLNWVLISGSYTASGGENYLIIGNFKDDANTSFILSNVSAPYEYSYYYIDDVSLTPCTAIEEQNQNETIKIYPNPSKVFINISFTSKEEKNVSVEVYDLVGRKVFEKQFQTSNTKLQTQIDMRGFPDGVYIVEINTGEGIYRKKVVKE
jgi:hypothetical protein